MALTIQRHFRLCSKEELRKLHSHSFVELITYYVINQHETNKRYCFANILPGQLHLCLFHDASPALLDALSA